MPVLLSVALDSQRIGSERASIGEFQQVQQRMIIDQLIAERAILDARQRGKLLGLLLDQPRTRSTVEGLHTR